MKTSIPAFRGTKRPSPIGLGIKSDAQKQFDDVSQKITIQITILL